MQETPLPPPYPANSAQIRLSRDNFSGYRGTMRKIGAPPAFEVPGNSRPFPYLADAAEPDISFQPPSPRDEIGHVAGRQCRVARWQVSTCGRPRDHCRDTIAQNVVRQAGLRLEARGALALACLAPHETRQIREPDREPWRARGRPRLMGPPGQRARWLTRSPGFHSIRLPLIDPSKTLAPHRFRKTK